VSQSGQLNAFADGVVEWLYLRTDLRTSLTYDLAFDFDLIPFVSIAFFVSPAKLLYGFSPRGISTSYDFASIIHETWPDVKRLENFPALKFWDFVFWFPGNCVGLVVLELDGWIFGGRVVLRP